MRTAVVYYALLAVTIPAALPAQAAPARIPPGTALGVTVDRFEIDDVRLLAGTFHLSSLKPGNLTPEFAIGVFPQAISAMVLVTNLDVGAAFNVPLPHATLLLRGGASGLFAFGSGGAGALPGIHYGASLLVRIAGRNGIRFDAIARRAVFLPYGVSSPFISLGVGITSLPGLR